MGKLKNGEIEKAEKKLKFTSYLQFQSADANREIDETEDEIALFQEAGCNGSKLEELQNRLEYWKGRRDAFQEILKYKNEKGV